MSTVYVYLTQFITAPERQHTAPFRLTTVYGHSHSRIYPAVRSSTFPCEIDERPVAGYV